MLRINHAFYTLSDLASELSVGWDEAFCRLINSNHSDRFFLSAFGKGSISRKGPCDLRDIHVSVRGLLSENPASPIPACQFFKSIDVQFIQIAAAYNNSLRVFIQFISTMLVIWLIESTSAYLR